MKGIDISVYQPNLNFKSIKASGVETVYIKATEGLTYNNKLLKSQYEGAKAAGLKIGFYHYLRANDPVAEAKHFLNIISGLKSDCLYGIDSEEQTEAVGISARTRKFADYLISQSKPVVLYTGEAFYNKEILPIVRDLPLWVAHYGLSKRPTIKSVGWQYNNTPYDLDIFDDGILLPIAKASVSKVSPKVTVKYPITLTVIATVLNVRVIGNTKGKLLGQIKKGAKVKVAGLSNSWYHIYFGNHGGYVSAQYLK